MGSRASSSFVTLLHERMLTLRCLQFRTIVYGTILAFISHIV